MRTVTHRKLAIGLFGLIVFSSVVGNGIWRIQVAHFTVVKQKGVSSFG